MSLRDWSSDVCSSDLLPILKYGMCLKPLTMWQPTTGPLQPMSLQKTSRLLRKRKKSRRAPYEIGRASCRERVEVSGAGDGMKKRADEVADRCDEARRG